MKKSNNPTFSRGNFRQWFVLFVVFFCSLTNLVAAQAADPTSIFQWNDSAVDVGTWYRYVTSDIDGKAPHNLYVYVSDSNHIQTLKNSYEDKTGNSIDFFNYTVDTHDFYFRSVELNNLLPAANNSYRSYRIDYDMRAGKMRASGVVNENNVEKPFNQAWDLPKNSSIYYSHLGMDVGFFFRFIKDPTKTFIMNFVDTLNSAHDVKVSYQKDEIVNGILCEKYSLEGQGILAYLTSNGGGVWLVKNDPAHYLVKFTMNVRHDWNYANWMTLLAERKPMTKADWVAFQEALVSEQKKKGEF